MAVLDTKERKRQAAVTHKRYGMAALAIPTLIVTLFAVGEGVGGEEGWWGHVIQLAIAAVLLVTAWYLPKIGGPVLVVAALAFGWWSLNRADDLVAELSTIAIIAVPLLLSGVFFTLAGYRDA